MRDRWSGNNYRAARALRQQMTHSEALVWARVRRHGFHGLKFYRQRPYGRFVLDFYCPTLRLAVEIDGASHCSPDARAADVERQHALEAEGIRFVRIAASAVERDVDAALERALSGYLPPPPATADPQRP